ncbi:STAS/SEC14 domain-containing protein [Pontibacter sp. SGAir0037]|uniref:STAS/SEC14 domain-containing protein n=1 Tax=Pontibacter sp. SGAir0037 TaxID=2571030 RepID=UPI0010CCC35C|nr:STAS/SEC14 domain-containing protein [Pontibacter sp. SGAir0037]QCR24528.1 STAS/SEC14 domain-containing protein [Pontibacter sp. SGAir0037]
MLQLLEESRGDLVAFKLSGSVDKQDYAVMLPVLDEKIKQYSKINVYAEVQEVDTYSLRALWDDLKYDFKHAADFRNVAIVGDKKWLDWLTVMATPFTTAKVKYFEPAQRAEAMQWAKADAV